ncbi:hypothetical protein KW786_01740 [Candidatus Parcubacteria bacterium]|nr:hypothetical protein [Candidatus Parcubacteria bacterium]
MDDSGLPASNPNEEKYRDELKLQAVIFRDVFNPFSKAEFEPGWRTPAVISIAQAARDEELSNYELDIPRLAILSDALEEAGCNNTEILGHLRGPGPHYRGCWVLDLILGKK